MFLKTFHSSLCGLIGPFLDHMTIKKANTQVTNQ